MRAEAGATAAVAYALGLTLALAPRAWAAGDCQAAFEKWALLSSAQVRTVAPGASNGRGACVSTEAVRQSLLDALARTRSLCRGSASDASLQQTLTLLNINHSFIASLGVCRSENVDAGAGWLTEASAGPRADAFPKTEDRRPGRPAGACGGRSAARTARGWAETRRYRAAPRADRRRTTPGRCRPSPGPQAPASGGPRPAAVARSPAPSPKPEVAAAAPPPKPPCLEMSEAGQAGRFAFVNRRCRGYTVIAVIETRGPTGKTACKGYEIDKSLAVLAPGNAPPRLNYECVASQRRCNKGRLGDMFPECEW